MMMIPRGAYNKIIGLDYVEYIAIDVEFDCMPKYADYVPRCCMQFLASDTRVHT